MSNIYWDVKTYDDQGEERETIRGLTEFQARGIMKILDREGVQAQTRELEKGGGIISSYSVNWPTVGETL